MTYDTPELLFSICAQIYSAGHPPPDVTLDPILYHGPGSPSAFPSSTPPAYWSEPTTRHTLSSLCLVNRAWRDAAKPWLWRKIEIRLPSSWLSIVDEIAASEDDDVHIEQAAIVVDKSIHTAMAAVLAQTLKAEISATTLQEKVFAELSGPDMSIPPELLSPPASRDPSPRRIRPKSRSPARWKLIQSISHAFQNVMGSTMPGIHVPTPDDSHPGPFVQHLDFSHFRSIGMRRSIDESVTNRFVTGDRIQAVLMEMPNLTAFGATEYMDGALTLPVLRELFLRGTPSSGRGRSTRARTGPDDPDEEDRERWRACKEIQALDFTGCISGVFVHAFAEFVTAHLLPPPEPGSEQGEDGNEMAGAERSARWRERHEADGMKFPGLKRLGLRGVKSFLPDILAPFILACPSLTHLDLSGTRVTPELLADLGETDAPLRSLGLSRCVRLTGESIAIFLVNGRAARGLRELNLYGDLTFPSPLSAEDMHDIFNHAPCFTNGQLVYLDISSTPVTPAHLATCSPQPALRSFGLSYIPDLDLLAIREFCLAKAPHIEVLTLNGTSPQLECGHRLTPSGAVVRGSPRQACVALHAQLLQPLCSPPFRLRPDPEHDLPPTRLRVVELATTLLTALGAGAGTWRFVRSKGGRGWYVDTASGWVSGVLRRNLPPDHLLRAEVERLAAANGNVSSGVGWHARKMEILHGHGMLGREDGLYGAVSFAYQG